MWPSVGWYIHVLVAVGLFLIVAAAFSNSFKSGMTLDNKYIIEEYYKALLRADPRHELNSWKQIQYIIQNDYWWPKGISGLYRPVTTFTYWVDYAVLTGKQVKYDQQTGRPMDNQRRLLDSTGRPLDQQGNAVSHEPFDPQKLSWTEYAHGPGNLDTTSYHWINLFLHWLNGLLVYFVALTLLHRVGMAALVAALFAVHPITTESVTNIIGRADIFAAVTVFGGLLLYVRATRSPGSWALPWIVGLSLIMTFGVFSKESAVSLALVLIVYDIAYRWRFGNEETKGLLPLIWHGVLYLLVLIGLVGLPLLASKYASDHKVFSAMPQAMKYSIAASCIGVAVVTYGVLWRMDRRARAVSLLVVAVALLVGALFTPWYFIVGVGAVVAAIELVRGTLTSESDCYKVVAHATLYLPLYFGLIGLPILALWFFRWMGWDVMVLDHKSTPQWAAAWLRYPLAAVAMAAGLFVHFFTVRSDRTVRVAALLVVGLASVVASFHSYWMGILVALIVATHEVILGSLTPRERKPPEYARDWRLVWNGFAVGYLALIPPIIAMFAVRDWVFRNSSPAETPFLDNPIRGIWQVAELNLPAFATELAAKPIWGLSFFECKMTAVKIMGKLLWLLTFPLNLSCDYSWHQIPNFSYTFHNGVEDLKAIVALLVMVFVFILVPIYAYRRNKAVFFFILFFFVAALPTSNLLVTIGSVMAERFMYLPLAGFTGVVVIFVFWLARKMWEGLKLGDEDDYPWHRLIAGSLLTVVVAGYGIRAFFRNYAWESDITLWEAAKDDSPRSFRTYQSLAFAYYERYMESIMRGKKPHELEPDVNVMIDTAENALPIVDGLPNHLNSSRLYLHLGMYYSIKGDIHAERMQDGSFVLSDEGRAWFTKAVNILERGSQVDRAFNEVNKSKQKRRGDPEKDITDAGLGPVYGAMANAYVRLGEYDKAIRRAHYQRQLDPSDIDAYIKLAQAQLGARRYDDASVTLIQCILLDGTRQEIWGTLAQLYGSIGERGVGTIVQEGNQFKLNLSHSIVRENLCQAYREFIRIFRRARRWQMAEEARKIAVERYQYPRSLFDPLFDEPIQQVTPDGVQYSLTSNDQ
jgi:tetratricopeptide (TPR) repeat protein